eukprot:COSAG01_NODE_9542_length_2414_cov_13.475594_2_plen_90_part_00
MWQVLASHRSALATGQCATVATVAHCYQMDVDEDDDLDDRGRIAPHDLPAWCAMALQISRQCAHARRSRRALLGPPTARDQRKYCRLGC